MKIKLIILFALFSSLAFGQKTQRNYWKDEIPRNPKGIWEFYDPSGELEQTYDFTKDSLLFQKTGNKPVTVPYRVIMGADTLLTKLDTYPVLIGGSATVGKTFRNYLKYPPEARESRIQGRVQISFLIDSNGKASNYKIHKGIGGACDEEALRVVKLIPNKWVAGTLNGKKVNTIYILPVVFRLG